MKRARPEAQGRDGEEKGESATGGKVRRVTFQALSQDHGPWDRTRSSHLAFSYVLYVTTCGRIM